MYLPRNDILARTVSLRSPSLLSLSLLSLISGLIYKPRSCTQGNCIHFVYLFFPRRGVSLNIIILLHKLKLTLFVIDLIKRTTAPHTYTTNNRRSSLPAFNLFARTTAPTGKKNIVRENEEEVNIRV